MTCVGVPRSFYLDVFKFFYSSYISFSVNPTKPKTPQPPISLNFLKFKLKLQIQSNLQTTNIQSNPPTQKLTKHLPVPKGEKVAWVNQQTSPLVQERSPVCPQRDNRGR